MGRVVAEPILKLTGVTFDQLLQRSNPFSGAACEFDLRDVELVTPSAVVQIAAASHALAKDGRRPTIRVERDSVRSYLARCGFIDAVEGVAMVEPAMNGDGHRFDHLRGSNLHLMEVTKIENGAALPELLDRIVELLRAKFKYLKYDALDIATVISEVAQNTFDHNTGTYGFIALQVYRGKKGRFAEIGVADCGLGLRTTLSRNPRFRITSDVHAIQLAAQLGVSQHNDVTRGTGLHHLLRIAYKHGGSVHIRSGAGKVSYRGDRQRGYGFAVPPMPGVQIQVHLGRRRTR
jgi:hypothetical protein